MTGNEHINIVKDWILTLLEAGRITRDEYEWYCGHLVQAQCAIDELLADLQMASDEFSEDNELLASL